MQTGRANVTRLRWLVLLAALAPHAIGAARAAQSPVEPPADIEVFTREGCPHCREAIRWLDELRARRPDVTVLVTDVGADPAGRARFASIAEQARTVAVPDRLVPLELQDPNVRIHSGRGRARRHRR